MVRNTCSIRAKQRRERTIDLTQLRSTKKDYAITTASNRSSSNFLMIQVILSSDRLGLIYRV
jgi:hypothetical protein